MQPTFKGMYHIASPMQNSFKSQLNVFIIFIKAKDERIENLDTFLATCNECNLKLSAEKYKFFQTMVSWCGKSRHVCDYQLDLWNKEAITNMYFPSTADERCYFIHRCRWMPSCIPNFHSISKPLREILEKAYTLCRKRWNEALKKVKMHKLSWGAIHEAAFENLKGILKGPVEVAYWKEHHVISGFMDAWNMFCAGIVT